jgi:succinate dehydrogenase / fumarate reductase cytochrome b subunit
MCLGFLKSSIGKKAVVAVTGLLLVGFVVAHMIGNLQIFLGPDAINGYAKKLQSLPLLLWPARFILLAIFAIHVTVSIKLAMENRAARPVAYFKKQTVRASRPSQMMILSGLVLLFFLIYHLLHFTFGVTHPDYFHLVDAQGRHDVYSMSVLSYRNVWLTAFYVLAMFFLCLHLSHGLQSFPQSLGFNDERLRPRLKTFANLTATVLFIGNSSMPLAAFLGMLKLPQGG